MDLCEPRPGRCGRGPAHCVTRMAGVGRLTRTAVRLGSHNLVGDAGAAALADGVRELGALRQLGLA